MLGFAAAVPVIVFFPVCFVLAIVLLILRLPRRDARVGHSGVVTVQRTSATVRYLGMTLGCLAAGLLWLPQDQGRLALLAPAVIAGTLLVAVLCGQWFAYGKARTAGAASLERRRIADYLPHPTTALAVLGVVVLAGLLVWAVVVGTPGEDGRPGVAYSLCDSADGSSDFGPLLEGRYPFPGAYYAVPLAIAIAALVALTASALRLNASRPRNGSDADLVAADDAVRRQTAEIIVAAAGFACWATSTAVASMAVGAMSARCGGATPVVVFGVALVSALAAAWCTALLLVPFGPRRSAAA